MQTVTAEERNKQFASIMYVWRVINVIMTVFFLLAALANVNDWDWFIWVPIYLLPAALSSALVFDPSLADSKPWSHVSVVHLTVCAAYALYLIVEVLDYIMSNMENPLKHEPGRELGGLLIIITWLAMNRFTNLGRPNVKMTSQGMMSALLLMIVTLTILPLFVWSLCFVSDWHTRLGHCNGMF